MPAPNPHTSAAILAAGKKEFLEKGYESASMRQIARAAGVTTGAIYGCFPDKASLFRALVKEAADGLMQAYEQEQVEFDALPPEVKAEIMFDYTSDSMDTMLAYIYDHIDAFKLILCASAGTEYEHYVDQIVAIEQKYTLRYMEAVKNQGYPLNDIAEEVVHILCSANYHAMFEVVAHDIPRDEAIGHIRQMVDFFKAGWDRLMGLNQLSTPIAKK